jgi:hypothetical protein
MLKLDLLFLLFRRQLERVLLEELNRRLRTRHDRFSQLFVSGLARFLSVEDGTVAGGKGEEGSGVVVEPAADLREEPEYGSGRRQRCAAPDSTASRNAGEQKTHRHEDMLPVSEIVDQDRVTRQDCEGGCLSVCSWASQRGKESAPVAKENEAI